MNIVQAREIAAQIWTREGLTSKVFDPDLAEAFAQELVKVGLPRVDLVSGRAAFLTRLHDELRFRSDEERAEIARLAEQAYGLTRGAVSPTAAPAGPIPEPISPPGPNVTREEVKEVSQQPHSPADNQFDKLPGRGELSPGSPG